MSSGTLTEQLQADDYGQDEGKKQDEFTTTTTAVAESYKEEAGVEIAVACDAAACDIPGAELVGVGGHRPEEHELMVARDEDHGAVEAQHTPAEPHQEAAEAHHVAEESHHQVTVEADHGSQVPHDAATQAHHEVTEAQQGNAEPHQGSGELQHGATEGDHQHGANEAHAGVDADSHHAGTDAHHGALEAHHATEEAQPGTRLEDESGAEPRDDIDRNTGLAPPAGEEMVEDPGTAIARTAGSGDARDASPGAHAGGSPHTEGEKEHKCPVEGCDKSYSLRKSYVDHIRKRHGLLSKDISGLSRDETIPITSTRPVGPRPRNPDDPIVEFRCQFPDCGRVYTLRKSWVDHARKRHNLHSKDLPPNYQGEVVVPGSARAAEHLAAMGAADATADQHMQGAPVVGVPGGHAVATPSGGDPSMQSGAAFEEGTVWQYLKKWAELSGSTMDDGDIVMSEVEREAAIAEMQKQGKSVEIVEALQGALTELAKATAAETGPAGLQAAAETHEILKAIKDAVESGRRFSPALLASVEKLHLGMKTSPPPPPPMPGMAGSFTASLRGDGAMVLSQPSPLGMHGVHGGQVAGHHAQVHDASGQMHHLHHDGGGLVGMGVGVGVDAVPVHLAPPGTLQGHMPSLPDAAHVALGSDLQASLGAMLNAASAVGAPTVLQGQGGLAPGSHPLVSPQVMAATQQQVPTVVTPAQELHHHGHHHHLHHHGGMLSDGTVAGSALDPSGHHLQGVHAQMHLQGPPMGHAVGVTGHHGLEAHGHLSHVMAASPPAHVQGPSPPQELLEGHHGGEMHHHLQPPPPQMDVSQQPAAQHLAPLVVSAADVVARAAQDSLAMHVELGGQDAAQEAVKAHLQAEGLKEMHHGGLGEDSHQPAQGQAHPAGLALGEVHERPEDTEGLEPSAKRHCT
eukprot:jgi/Mesvir1/6066/Mv00796-RA.2